MMSLLIKFKYKKVKLNVGVWLNKILQTYYCLLYCLQLIYFLFIFYLTPPMKHQNRIQFLKKLALWVFGVSFVSVLYAQLNIPTDIDNSIQTIKRIVITDNGRADGNMVVGINVSGAQNTLQVSGSMMA